MCVYIYIYICILYDRFICCRVFFSPNVSNEPASEKCTKVKEDAGILRKIEEAQPCRGKIPAINQTMIHAYTHISLSLYIYIYTHICVYIYTYIYIYTYMYTCVIVFLNFTCVS